MAQDAPFIDAIRRDAEPDVARLIYADWLDDRGAGARAEYLRLLTQLKELWTTLANESDAPHRLQYVEPIARATLRLRELCNSIEREWLAQVHRGKVKKCDYSSREQPACPSLWEKLEDTDSPLVRRCGQCDDRVNFCFSWSEAEQHKRTVMMPMHPEDFSPFRQ